MRSAPKLRMFVGRYRDDDDRLLPARMRIACAHQIARIVRGMREKPGTISCEDRISAPLYVGQDFAFRFSRVMFATKRI